MLNEFIEKIIVHEGEGRGTQRRQRLDFYFNFIGTFEVPSDIVTPMEQEAERRQQEEQAEKEERSQALAKPGMKSASRSAGSLPRGSELVC